MNPARCKQQGGSLPAKRRQVRRPAFGKNETASGIKQVTNGNG